MITVAFVCLHDHISARTYIVALLSSIVDFHSNSCMDTIVDINSYKYCCNILTIVDILHKVHMDVMVYIIV